MENHVRHIRLRWRIGVLPVERAAVADREFTLPDNVRTDVNEPRADGLVAPSVAAIQLRGAIAQARKDNIRGDYTLTQVPCWFGS